jgi:hypothetical protein
MAFQLFFCQRCFKQRNQIAGRYDFAAKRSHQFDGSRVDSRNIRIAVAWRIFHRNILVSSDDVPDRSFQFLPFQIDDLIARQMIQCIGFNSMNKFLRYAARRDKVEVAS